MTYGEVLRKLMDERDVSVIQLAREVGLSRQSIYSYMYGLSKEPTLGNAKAIADALGVSLQSMVDMMGES